MAQREVEQVRDEKEVTIAELTRENETQSAKLAEAESAREALEDKVKAEKLRAAELKERMLQRSLENESGNGNGSVRVKSEEVKAWQRKLAELREAKDEKIIALSDALEEKERDLADHQKFIAQLKKRNEHLNAKNEGLMMENGELEARMAVMVHCQSECVTDWFALCAHL